MVMRLSFITKGVMIMDQMARVQAGWGKQSWPLPPGPYSHPGLEDTVWDPDCLSRHSLLFQI